MLKSFRRWKRRRKNLRRRQKMNDPAYYPPDMDPNVVQTIIRVKDFTMTSAERINGLCETVRYIAESGIQGDIVECGVWRGGSMMAVADTLKRMGDTDRQLHLFDTFEGMNDPTEKDVSFNGQAAETLLDEQSKEDPTSVWCVSGIDEVKANVRSIGYPENNIHFYKGMVEETLPAGAPEKIAILRLDTDWYESTRHEMIHLFPRLVDGGVLIIDDYGHWEGARRAVDEYLSENKIGLMLHRLDYTGRIGVYHAGIEKQQTIASGYQRAA